MKSNKYMITTLNEYLNESDLLYRSGDVIKKVKLLII